MAIQKFGMAVPNAVSSEMPTSAGVPGRTAASVPRTRATSTASRRESRASSRLSGSRAAIAPSTGWPVRKDRPQSPWVRRPSQSAYWT